MSFSQSSSPHPNQPRGWHSRGYLPHADFVGSQQFITYHLEDSLPAHVAHRLNSEMSPDAEPLYRKRIEAYLDAGHGDCILQNDAVAQIVADAWTYYHGTRYDLVTWVIMPNHVHLLITMRETSMEKIIHGWKSYTTQAINKLLGRSGPLWHRDYWDRYIRDARHYKTVVNYIRQNPVKAGLVESPEMWKWVSVPAESTE